MESSYPLRLPLPLHYGIYAEARGRAQKEAIAWFDEHVKRQREGDREL